MSSSLTLKRKLEEVVMDWVEKGAVPALAGYGLYHGHRKALQAQKALTAVVTQVRPAWASGEGGPLESELTLEIVLKTPVVHDDENKATAAEEAHDAAAAALGERLRDVGSPAGVCERGE